MTLLDRQGDEILIFSSFGEGGFIVNMGEMTVSKIQNNSDNKK